MLDIIGVEKTFNPGTVNEKKALRGIDLHLDEGDFVTVIGGNGAGKSTMLNMIAGVYPVDCGNIIVDGVDVTKLPEHKRAKYLGRVFQDPMTGTAADMHIEENLALAARRGAFRGLRAGITSKERKEYKELLKILDLGLEERLTAKVGKLLAFLIQLVADVSESNKLIHYTKSLGSALCVQDALETDDAANPSAGHHFIVIPTIERFSFSESCL